MITQAQLDNWFTHHPPRDLSTAKAYEKIREKGKELAEVIVALTPISADQAAAIRKVREAVMTANAAIACGGK